MNENIKNIKKELADSLHTSIDDNCIDLFISLLIQENPFNPNDYLDNWLSDINKNQPFYISKKSISDLSDWFFNGSTGDLEHKSGRFFSIRGLRVETNKGIIPKWDQPIIDQQEIGILGILTKKFDGVLYFLMQAKAEPGNINHYQLSPTVQATRSNFQMIHQGKPTNYLKYFVTATASNIIIDQLQSEQGARFFNKRKQY